MIMSTAGKQVPIEINNRSSRLFRLNAICPYYTMFPLHFPFNCLKKAKRDEWVLDPFCGRGTTLFAARLKGCPSIGIDANRVAVDVSRSKFVDVTPNDVHALCKSILKKRKKITVPEGEFWDLCYHKETLHQIAAIREELIHNCQTDSETALKSLMLGILHGPIRKITSSYLSNQMPRTYSSKPDYSIRYWKKNNMAAPKIDVLELVKRRATYVFDTIPSKVSGDVMLADSRLPYDNMPHEGFKWVITSPPYVGMVTYNQDQWLRDWFSGGKSEVDYRKGNQLGQTSQNNYVTEIAKVWKNVADVCAPKAKMIVRLGVLPSYKGDPKEIIHRSIELSRAEWKLTSLRTAGKASVANRQAEHFGLKIGSARQEIDCYLELS